MRRAKLEFLMLTVFVPAMGVPPESRPNLVSIESLSSPIERGDTGRVALRGVVTLVRERFIYVQDQTGAIPVFTAEMAHLAIGDEVELQGEYRRRDAAGALYGASIRRLWSGSAPVPVALKPEQAAEGSYRNRLIDTEGRLLQKRFSDGQLRLTLEGAGQVFGATLELSSPIGGSTQLAKALEEDSTLRLVGVCALGASADQSVGNAFVVLLRSTDDLRVITPAPWWNLRHAAWLGCAAVVVLLLLYRIRDRALKLRYQAIVEERSRIAREMHDTLAQGFSGLTYQLEGLARALNASVEKSSIERHLGMALQLVRHCREEAHRSIFALRSLTQTDPDLLALLLSSCDSVRTWKDVRLVSVREGKPLPIPDEVLNHLLRIGQEAITNALQHAHASEIRVLVRFGDSDVRMEIADNGAGFDIESVRSVEAGRFGITGMRERAKHLRAALDILSEEGGGTTIVVVTPLATRSSWRSIRHHRNGSSEIRQESHVSKG